MSISRNISTKIAISSSSVPSHTDRHLRIAFTNYTAQPSRYGVRRTVMLLHRMGGERHTHTQILSSSVFLETVVIGEQTPTTTHITISFRPLPHPTPPQPNPNSPAQPSYGTW